MIHLLLADTRTLRVLEGTGTALNALTEVVTFRNPEAARHERDLGSDRPGRVINGPSGIHQAYERSVSAKQHSMTTWLKGIGPSLQNFLASRSSTGVVLVAAPRTLAQVRKCLPVALNKRVVGELRLDLAQRPLGALRKRVQPALRAAELKLARSEPMYRRATPARRERRAAT
jgi:protein required for attachment to host cells